MADFENAEHFVKLLIGVTSVAVTGGTDLASALTIAETLGHASKLDKAIREMGLHDVAKRLAKTAKEVETRLSTNSDFTGTGLADATALFQQTVKYCIPTPDQVVANNLSGARIADWMLAQIEASPVGRDFYNASLAARYLREVVTPTLNALVEDEGFRAKMLEPGLWRRSLDFAEHTNSMVKEIFADRDKTENPIRLKLSTAQKLAAQFGATFGDVLDRENLESFLETAAERAVDLSQRLLTPSNEDDPVVQNLRKQAAKLIDDGEYDQADAQLTLAEERDAAIETEHEQAAIRSRLSRAKSRSERGDLARLRLRYRDAADHYAAAAAVVPISELDAKLGYQFARARVLHSLGTEFGDRAALTEAIETIRNESLPLAARERVPMDWAGTQINLGNLLLALGQHDGDPALLDEAAEAFRAALQECTRERAPQAWATTQNNLGAVLQELGSRDDDTARMREAIVAYREALLERTRERVPLDWAATQNNIGVTLKELGRCTGDNTLMREAVDAYRKALLEYTRESVPLEWAATKSNIGNVLGELGTREGDIAVLREAVDTCREALLENTRERVPLSWAGTMNNLGTILQELGRCTGDSALLRGAVDAYRDALLEVTRKRAPVEWATTQNNLGAALGHLGTRAGDASLVQLAVTAFHAALEERTRDRAPLDRTQTQNNLSFAHLALFRLTSNPADWRAAHDANTLALDLLRTADAPAYLAEAEATRLRILGSRPSGEPN